MLRLSVAVSLCCLAASAWAFDPDLRSIEDLSLMQKYPSGSISSPEKAHEALAAVKAADEKLAKLLSYSSQRCAENFLVNSCRDDVRKAGIRQKRRLAAIETEADKVLRAQETADYEAQQQERAQQKASSAPKPSAARSPKGADPQAAENTLNYFDKRREETAKRQQAYEEKKAQEDQREAEYQKKLADRAQRQAQREEQLKKRAEQDAAREAKIRAAQEARAKYDDAASAQ